MSNSEAVPLLNECLAHLWMIRTYLKHQEEVQNDEEMIEVPRLLYDSIRAVEPSFLKGDFDTYVRRLRGKVGKLKKNAEFFAREYKRVSAHTNYEMASISYTAAVRRIEEILAMISDNPTHNVDNLTPIIDDQSSKNVDHPIPIADIPSSLNVGHSSSDVMTPPLSESSDHPASSNS
ncbi:MAG: hypothetical protein N2112_04155 [Gemmataceae bacterium]|jgi:hypothetical protein|nr:hypothetical protein [Gemmataceae bacterium]